METQAVTYSDIKRRIDRYYTAQKRVLLRIEKKYLETNTTDLLVEISEINGILKGLKKARDLIDHEMNDNIFPELLSEGTS